MTNFGSRIRNVERGVFFGKAGPRTRGTSTKISGVNRNAHGRSSEMIEGLNARQKPNTQQPRNRRRPGFYCWRARFLVVLFGVVLSRKK